MATECHSTSIPSNPVHFDSPNPVQPRPVQNRTHTQTTTARALFVCGRLVHFCFGMSYKRPQTNPRKAKGNSVMKVDIHSINVQHLLSWIRNSTPIRRNNRQNKKNTDLTSWNARSKMNWAGVDWAGAHWAGMREAKWLGLVWAGLDWAAVCECVCFLLLAYHGTATMSTEGHQFRQAHAEHQRARFKEATGGRSKPHHHPRAMS